MKPEQSFHCVDWPAPEQVRAIVSHRGAKLPLPYSGNNLALHVGDLKARVEANRSRLAHNVGVKRWQWLEQVHGVDVVHAAGPTVCADGSITEISGLALAVLTADCLPILLCDVDGTQIAAIHAGWRGLAGGIVSRAVNSFSESPQNLMAYIGPAIGQKYYEVDTSLLSAFQSACAFKELDIKRYFEPVQQKPGHYWADLAGLARAQLTALGVARVYGGDICTFAQSQTYYSFRKHSNTGRFVSAIWLNEV